MKCKKILVIDDDYYIRTLLRLTLDSKSHYIYEAVDGEQALEVIDQEMPDVLILDIMMPGKLDGFELCKIVKSTESTSKIKVILISAKAEQADIDHGRELGADCYITKPFSPLALLKQI